MTNVRLTCLVALFFCFLGIAAPAADPAAPVLTNLSVSNRQMHVSFTPYPSSEAYTFLSTTNLNTPFLPNTNFVWSGARVGTVYATNGTIITTNVLTRYDWHATNTLPSQFNKLQVTPMGSKALLTAIVLNRLAYGPTPDELERVLTGTNAIGPKRYISEQLAPELVTETIDNFPEIYKIKMKMADQTTPLYLGGSQLYASISELRAWHVMRAVGAKRQLLEILLQFMENHFVTQYSKSYSYLGIFGYDETMSTRVAPQFEYWENANWRNALLNPGCTFYDLLKVSAESPAMVIYLDTALSKGSNGQQANENYARELMELFTMGVNNGYDQTDITSVSRCWTGWSVQKVAPSNAFNPFATPLSGSVNTNVGVWALNYRAGDHDTNSKTIFAGKTVPARFGAPWAGRSYQINIPARGGNAGMQDGYDVITNLANLPFTEEFISVKLCRLFVHDGFAQGYDFTSPNVSDEGQLVKQCMLAWENSTPKGQIRAVLRTIFDSALFQGNGAAFQKVKTPLEFTVSAVRALRCSTNGTGNPGSFTSDTDGYSISGIDDVPNYPLSRMGGMLLFDRQDPNGYPEDAPGWISAGTLDERVRWIQTYCMILNDPNKSDSPYTTCDPVGLLQSKLPLQNPPGSITDAAAIVDYLLKIIYPGEGTANLALYRAAAISFMSLGDDGVTPSPLSSLSTVGSPSPLETRIRGGVALLMSFQRFNEQ
jgi:uncharacterized protein (DUF1800 family)